jgi:hypothetical protein
MARPNILPTAPRAPQTNFLQFTWLFYGLPGVGKTTLASRFPKPLFLATEDGTKAIESWRKDVTSWADFEALVEALRTEDHDFRTVVVDTVDLLYPLCLKAVCDDLGVSHPSDAEWGKGWQTLRTRWLNGINRLRTAKRKDGRPLCVVFISHESQTEIRIKRGRRVEDTGRYHVSSALSGKSRTILHSAVDFIVRIEMDGDERIMRTQPASVDEYEIEAKGRGSLGTSLPDTIPLDFGALLSAFDNTLGRRAEGDDR